MGAEISTSGSLMLSHSNLILHMIHTKQKKNKKMLELNGTNTINKNEKAHSLHLYNHKYFVCNIKSHFCNFYVLLLGIPDITKLPSSSTYYTLLCLCACLPQLFSFHIYLFIYFFTFWLCCKLLLKVKLSIFFYYTGYVWLYCIVNVLDFFISFYNLILLLWMLSGVAFL